MKNKHYLFDEIMENIRKYDSILQIDEDIDDAKAKALSTKCNEVESFVANVMDGSVTYRINFENKEIAFEISICDTLQKEKFDMFRSMLRGAKKIEFAYKNSDDIVIKLVFDGIW